MGQKQKPDVAEDCGYIKWQFLAQGYGIVLAMMLKTWLNAAPIQEKGCSC